MSARCPRCDAELGPHEDPRGCVTCQGLPLGAVATRAVAVLETVVTPLRYWDIKRMMEADGGFEVWEQTLKTHLPSDWRTCWAGPGYYGLYRHGLLPGVRDLASAGSVFLHASDRTLTLAELNFIMRTKLGYSFQEGSLRSALNRACFCQRLDASRHGCCPRSRRAAGRGRAGRTAPAQFMRTSPRKERSCRA